MKILNPFFGFVPHILKQLPLHRIKNKNKNKSWRALGVLHSVISCCFWFVCLYDPGKEGLGFSLWFTLTLKWISFLSLFFLDDVYNLILIRLNEGTSLPKFLLLWSTKKIIKHVKDTKWNHYDSEGTFEYKIWIWYLAFISFLNKQTD